MFKKNHFINNNIQYIYKKTFNKWLFAFYYLSLITFLILICILGIIITVSFPFDKFKFYIYGLIIVCVFLFLFVIHILFVLFFIILFKRKLTFFLKEIEVKVENWNKLKLEIIKDNKNYQRIWIFASEFFEGLDLLDDEFYLNTHFYKIEFKSKIKNSNVENLKKLHKIYWKQFNSPFFKIRALEAFIWLTYLFIGLPSFSLRFWIHFKNQFSISFEIFIIICFFILLLHIISSFILSTKWLKNLNLSFIKIKQEIIQNNQITNNFYINNKKLQKILNKERHTFNLEGLFSAEIK